jgi:hypothetical protein
MGVQTASQPEPLDVHGALEALLTEEEAPPEERKVAKETPPAEEDLTQPKVEEPGEEPEPIAAEEEGEPAAEEEGEPGAEEEGDGTVRTMSDLAEMFEIEEAELLGHLQIAGSNGETVSLARVIETYHQAPEAVRQFEELKTQKAAFEQEAANLRTRTDESIRELAVNAQVLLDMTNEEFKDVDWSRLEREDQTQYLILKTKQQDRAKVIQGAVEKMRGLEQGRTQEIQAVTGAQRQEQISVLHEKMPSWRDPVVATAAMKETHAYLTETGFSADEIDGIADHRAIMVAWEAAQYRKLKNQTPKKLEKLKGLPNLKRVLKTGSRRDASADNTKDAQKKIDRLKKTGDDRDAAAIFEGMI